MRRVSTSLPRSTQRRTLLNHQAAMLALRAVAPLTLVLALVLVPVPVPVPVPVLVAAQRRQQEMQEEHATTLEPAQPW